MKADYEGGGQNTCIEAKIKCVFQISFHRAICFIEFYVDAPVFNATEYTLGKSRAL
jgi:hypothetical protein